MSRALGPQSVVRPHDDGLCPSSSFWNKDKRFILESFNTKAVGGGLSTFDESAAPENLGEHSDTERVGWAFGVGLTWPVGNPGKAIDLSYHFNTCFNCHVLKTCYCASRLSRSLEHMHFAACLHRRPRARFHPNHGGTRY